jgi:allantoicase
MEIPIDTSTVAAKAKELTTSTLPSTSDSGITTVPIPASLIDTTFTHLTNLSSSALGATVVSTSDEWFAGAANLLMPAAPVWKEGVFVHAGKWMDGWETRRHNPAEFDWVVIKLGCVGVVEGVEVDTTWFNGNEAPEAGLEGVCIREGDEKEKEVGKEGFMGWEEILPKRACGPSRRQAWKVSGGGIEGKEFTHLKIKMFPDGGISRLRTYGRVVPPGLPVNIAESAERPVEDLASALNGGVAVARSDEHFGVKGNLILPGRGENMGDGWETARSRAKGHVDWVIIKLGLKGKVLEKAVVDTRHFRGNFPRAVKLEALSMPLAKAALSTEGEPKHDGAGWKELTKGEQKCQADFEHVFEGDALAVTSPPEGEVWTHVKMTIIPDGGVKRLRVFGRRA